MSKSRKDKRGGHIPSDIGVCPKIMGDKVALYYGWDGIGDPVAKRRVKKKTSRLRRMADKAIISNEMKE